MGQFVERPSNASLLAPRRGVEEWDNTLVDEVGQAGQSAQLQPHSQRRSQTKITIWIYVLVYPSRYPPIKLEHFRHFIITINPDIDSNPIGVVDLGQAFRLKLERQNSLNRNEAGLSRG